jgi:hypothetical protein
MTTLELITDSPPYKFKSLGVRNSDTDDTGIYGNSDDFKIGTEYELTDGKFPLTDYTDIFSESGLYHTLNGNIKVKIDAFNGSCEEGDINKYGSCQIIVEKVNVGGRKKRNLKSKSKRRKSNRRKSNRRKSNRRR